MLTDKGSELKSAFSDIVASITAGSTFDNVEYLGNEIDILGFNSGKLSINYITSLTSAKTLSFAVKIYQCDTSGGSYDSGTTILASTVVATGTKSGFESTYDLNVPQLNQYKRYIKFGVTPDLSHTSTDTVALTASFILTGADKLPVS